MDIPSDFGAYTSDCGSFTPPVAAGAGKRLHLRSELSCETEAGQYNAGARTIGGMDRRTWSQGAERTLTHANATCAVRGGRRVVLAPTIPAASMPSGARLTELAAIVSEFKPVHHKALGLAGKARAAELGGWFQFWVKNGGEDITGNLRHIRCECDCGPANSLTLRKCSTSPARIGTPTRSWLYRRRPCGIRNGSWTGRWCARRRCRWTNSRCQSHRGCRRPAGGENEYLASLSSGDLDPLQ